MNPLAIFVLLLSITKPARAEDDIQSLCTDINESTCTRIFIRAVEHVRKEIATQMKIEKEKKIEPIYGSFLAYVIDDFNISANLGYTNASGETDDQSGSVIEKKIEDKVASSVKVGWTEKPLIRHFRDFRNKREKKRTKDEQSRDFFDYLTFSLYWEYGSTITDSERPKDEFKAKTESTYYGGFDFELPLSDVPKILGIKPSK